MMNGNQIFFPAFAVLFVVFGAEPADARRLPLPASARTKVQRAVVEAMLVPGAVRQVQGSPTLYTVEPRLLQVATPAAHGSSVLTRQAVTANYSASPVLIGFAPRVQVISVVGEMIAVGGQ